MPAIRRQMIVCGALLFAAAPSHACIDVAAQDINDVRYADLVVVGKIENYRKGERNRSWSGVRFDIAIDDVMKGRPARRTSATWVNSTFKTPDSMADETYIIALRHPSSLMPPLRGASAFIPPSPDIKAWTVLQAPCAEAFILSYSPEVRAIITRVLAGDRVDNHKFQRLHRLVVEHQRRLAEKRVREIQRFSGTAGAAVIVSAACAGLYRRRRSPAAMPK